MEVLDRADGVTLEEVVMGTSLEGTTVNTDEWNGYNGPAHMPWDHAAVSHPGPKSTWARDDDGDGIREVHCNTLEGLWTGLRNFLRPFRGVSKWYLAQYIAIHRRGYNIKQATDEFLKILLGIGPSTNLTARATSCLGGLVNDDALPTAFRDDVDRYMRLVTTGGFYEALMGVLDVPHDRREDLKRTLYRNVFYGKVRVQRGSEEGKAFRRLFPTIHDLLLDLKEGQHHRSSRMMQKVEAHFVYDRICTRIEAERPQIFLGTIHDALVTTPDQAGYVRRIMAEEFARVGVTPTIRDK